MAINLIDKKVTVSASGLTTIAVNPDLASFAPGTSASKRVIKVVAFHIQNQSAGPLTYTWAGSTTGAVYGPESLSAIGVAVTGDTPTDWAEFVSGGDGYLFMCPTRGENLQISASGAGSAQVHVTYYVSLRPGDPNR